MTYVSMFPQLIAGPIVRYETVERELKTRTINYEGFKKGTIRFLVGLFKKVLIANNIGQLWDYINSSNFGEISVSTAWLGAVAFIFGNFVRIRSYKVCTADKGFLGSGV